jgi:TolB-like protein/Tfp pilus assembly protein PilF
VRLGLIPPPRSKAWQTGRKFAALVGLVVIGAAAVFAFWLPGHKAADPPPVLAKSIAILPFLDLSPTKDKEYFSDGITEEIINSLAHVHGLFVVARTSAFSFKNKNMDIREVGRRLGVSHVLEGSVNRGTSKVRVDTRLIDVATGYHLWSETYYSTERDLLSLQSDVAKKVASALQIELHLATAKNFIKPPTQDPEAYDLYLRGRYLLNKRTPDSIRNGRVLFERAVGRDANFALGHTGIADSYILLGEYGVLSTDEAARRAWPEVTAAIKLDEHLAEGYISRAILHTDFEWNSSEAEADYRKAIELNPNSATAHHWYALLLAQLARTDESLQEITIAQERDPLAPIIRAARAKILLVGRRFEDAVAQSRKALELEPNFAPAYSVVAQAYAFRQQYPEALEAAKKYVDLTGGGDQERLELVYVQAVAGQKTEAQKVVSEVQSRGGNFSPYDMAAICVALGDRAGALQWLQRAIEQRSIDVVWVRVDPRMDNIRSEVDFRGFIARIVPASPAAD